MGAEVTAMKFSALQFVKLSVAEFTVLGVFDGILKLRRHPCLSFSPNEALSELPCLGQMG